MPEPTTSWGKKLVQQFSGLAEVVTSLELRVKEYDGLKQFLKGALWIASACGVVAVALVSWNLLTTVGLKSDTSAMNATLSNTADRLKELAGSTKELNDGANEMRSLLTGFSNSVDRLDASIRDLKVAVAKTSQTAQQKSIWWREQVDASQIAEGEDNIRLRISDSFLLDPSTIQNVSARIGLGMPKELGTNSLSLLAELSEDRKYVHIRCLGDSGKRISNYLKRSGNQIPLELELTFLGSDGK